MKILLIQVNESEGGVIPVCLRPLALESLAAHLEDHEVRILDLRVDELPLADHLAAFDPDLVGVSCTFTSGLYPTQRTLRAVRQLAPRAKIVVGGAHASVMPGDFRYPLADYLVRGPGERALAQLAQALQAGAAVRVPGVFSLEADGSTSGEPLPQDYRWSKEYRQPARQLTARYASHYPAGPAGQTIVYMVSSRGCPYRCKFCSAWRIQGGKLDTREPQCIYNEISAAEEQLVYFFDDNSLANRRRMRQLAELLRQGGVGKNYQMWVSADLICRERDLLQLWREVGLLRVFSGLESINSEHLLRLGKRADLQQNERAIEVCRDLDLALTPTFIVDQSFDADDFSRLADYAQERQLHLPYFFLLTPLPGTDLFHELAPQISEGDPSCYDLYHLVVPPSRLAPQEFLQRFVELYCGNPSWQQAAQRTAVYADLLRNLQGLLAAPGPRRPVSGLDPQLAAFPPAA